MEVTKLTKQNHYEAIAEQIKQLITAGSLKPGDKLPSTKQMSEQFGVGRSTTREALSALKAMGLIDIRQGGGCTVIGPPSGPAELPELEKLRLNKATLLELLEARKSFESSNAALAAGKRTKEDIDSLKRIVEQMKDAIGDEAEGERTDIQFHLTIAKATHNAVLLQLYESVMNEIEAAIRDVRRVEIYANAAVASQLYEQHSAIFMAVASGNSEAAEAEMKRHLGHIESILHKYM
ncbi:FadR/GntR family transcriptional regulator [Paenibacillus protaetiae]|uniref:FadR family transcriptional regulator n=1 Tax=Paenibacillus protaetiae TaxID=2509456 RepID=A0A4P6ER75_9BACL|nr:FadR/GntR family transcriptional regulator [Paenibacillus protaetiae]QAY65520.1 FadR family transcriptional regulator [Paenibacillus protaetiae]